MTVPVVRRIVVGVDGSTASAEALRWACREARLRGAHVHVVQAWEPTDRHVASYAWPARVPVQTDPSDCGITAARDDLKRLVDSIDERGVVVNAEVVEGLPARFLLDRANGADMLVLGTASHSAARTAGPVIRACVNRAPCPVVVIGAGQAVPPDVEVAAVSASGVRVG
jgi:nucleotide-binding universal stress UspA family protein